MSIANCSDPVAAGAVRPSFVAVSWFDFLRLRLLLSSLIRSVCSRCLISISLLSERNASHVPGSHSSNSCWAFARSLIKALLRYGSLESSHYYWG